LKKLRVLPEAEEELQAAAVWYESKRTGLGVELISLVDRALAEIMDAPLACALWREDRPYRRKIVKRLPYAIFFEVQGDVVEVIAIAHAKRRPGYWVDRGHSRGR
jgi:plasmid stabilization system protein ParE